MADSSSSSPLTVASILDRIGLRSGLLRALARPILAYLKIPQVVTHYNRLQGALGLQFVAQHLAQMQLQVTDSPDNSLLNIPLQGPLIIVSNHPTGLTDGLALLQFLSRARHDLRVVINYLMGEIEETNAIFKEIFIYVNPFDQAKQSKSSHRGMREIFKALQLGQVVIFFPAADVSTFDWGSPKIRDEQWNATFCKMIGRMDAPVLPVHIDNRNSRWFYFINKLSNKLGLALLFREHLRQKGRTIPISVGTPQLRLPEESSEAFAIRLRSMLDALGNPSPPRA